MVRPAGIEPAPLPSEGGKGLLRPHMPSPSRVPCRSVFSNPDYRARRVWLIFANVARSSAGRLHVKPASCVCLVVQPLARVLQHGMHSQGGACEAHVRPVAGVSVCRWRENAPDAPRRRRTDARSRTPVADRAGQERFPAFRACRRVMSSPARPEPKPR